MYFELKVGIIGTVGVAVIILMFIPPISWNFPISSYVQYGLNDEQRGFGLEYIPDTYSLETDELQYIDANFKFVKLTDSDLEEVTWLMNLIHNNQNTNSETDISLQDWNNYVSWIREKYLQQFGEKLENSWEAYLEYNDAKYKTIFYR